MPVCCNKQMMKAGFGWSGKNKQQRYRCNQCGKTTTRKDFGIKKEEK